MIIVNDKSLSIMGLSISALELVPEVAQDVGLIKQLSLENIVDGTTKKSIIFTDCFIPVYL
jgi:hypothetical protein